jgi:hypothetical protein
MLVIGWHPRPMTLDALRGKDDALGAHLRSLVEDYAASIVKRDGMVFKWAIGEGEFAPPRRKASGVRGAKTTPEYRRNPTGEGVPPRWRSRRICGVPPCASEAVIERTQNAVRYACLAQGHARRTNVRYAEAGLRAISTCEKRAF